MLSLLFSRSRAGSGVKGSRFSILGAAVCEFQTCRGPGRRVWGWARLGLGSVIFGLAVVQVVGLRVVLDLGLGFVIGGLGVVQVVVLRVVPESRRAKIWSFQLRLEQRWLLRLSGLGSCVYINASSVKRVMD